MESLSLDAEFKKEDDELPRVVPVAGTEVRLGEGQGLCFYCQEQSHAPS